MNAETTDGIAGAMPIVINSLWRAKPHAKQGQPPCSQIGAFS